MGLPRRLTLAGWNWRRPLCILLALLFMAIRGGAAPTEPGTIPVVLDRGAAPVTVERNMLGSIFAMRLRHWPNGDPITVFVLADDDPVHVRFCVQILATYPYVLRDAWDRQVFSGTGQGPIQVRSEEEMAARLAATPGAIGYLPRGREAAPLRELKVN